MPGYRAIPLEFEDERACARQSWLITQKYESLLGNFWKKRQFLDKSLLRSSVRILWLPLIQKRQHILLCHRACRLKLPVFLAEQQFAVALQHLAVVAPVSAENQNHAPVGLRSI